MFALMTKCGYENDIRTMRWAGHVAHSGEVTSTYWILVRKSESKNSLAIARHSSEDNIKIDIQELGHEGVDWIDLTRDSKELAATVKMLIKLVFQKVRKIYRKYRKELVSVVGWSVGSLVRWLVGWLVGWLVCLFS